MIRAVVLSFSLAIAAATPACALVPDDASEVRGRRADVEGTWESASSLMFAASASVFRDEASVTVALTLNGGRAGDTEEVETCHRYASLEVTIDGHALEAKSVGGWTGATPLGCRFPRYSIRSKDLFTETGTVDVSITIAGERRELRIEHWLVTRSLDIPANAFVPGKVVSIGVGPRYEGLMGDLDSATLFSSENDIHQTWIPVRWNAERIELPLVDRIPTGEAELTFEERRIPVIHGCPFAMCGARVDRTTKRTVIVTASE